ncbi:MAG: hypothetical protein M3Q03_17320, partial [Chloroflexota bacterium]|nr:hypothetical protein [Chloroflexota bacterium]
MTWGYGIHSAMVRQGTDVLKLAARAALGRVRRCITMPESLSSLINRVHLMIRSVAPRAARPTVVLLALAWAMVPWSAGAHERWFTPEGPYWAPEWGRLFSLPVLLALLSAGGAVALLAAVQRVTGDPLWPRPPFFQRMEPAAAAILGVQTAITMIFMASRLKLFVPNIELSRNAFGVLVAGLTVVASFSFITGVLTRIGAVMVVGLFLLAFAFGTWYEVLEQIIFVGIAVYLVAVGRGVVRYESGQEEDRTALSDRLLPYALPA